MSNNQIKIKALEKIAIETPTQKSFNELLKILEYYGYKWRVSKSLPTEKKEFWGKYKEKTCLEIESDPLNSIKGTLGYGKKDVLIRQNYTVISIEDFYNIEKINKRKLGEIDKYFLTRKINFQNLNK